MSLNFDRMPKDKTIVDALTLSSFMSDVLHDRKVDFVKMDIEESEWEVVTELSEQGYLGKIGGLAIEYHHRIGTESSRLAKFLASLEEAGFEYLIDSSWLPMYYKLKVQNINISAFRKSRPAKTRR